jgi:hypothetical protein
VEIKWPDYESIVVRLIEQRKWPSSDGTIQNISTMNNDHIINCIEKIKRDNWRLEYLPLFEAELEFRSKPSRFLRIRGHRILDGAGHRIVALSIADYHILYNLLRELEAQSGQMENESRD